MKQNAAIVGGGDKSSVYLGRHVINGRLRVSSKRGKLRVLTQWHNIVYLKNYQRY